MQAALRRRHCIFVAKNALLVIILLVIAIPLMYAKRKSDQTHNQSEGSQNEKNTANLLTPSASPTPVQQNVNIVGLPKVEVHKDFSDRGIWLFSLMLVVVGLLQWLVLRNQERIMGKHAEHLENLAAAAKDNANAALGNAEAARSNAQAVISSERAWVLLERTRSPDTWFSGNNPGYVPGAILEFRCYGRTPARVTKGCYLLEAVPAKSGSVSPEPALPSVPNYMEVKDPEIPESGRLFPPGATFTVPLSLKAPLNEEEWVELRDGKTIMCTYGFLEYEDAFGRKNNTRFCYVYHFQWGAVLQSPDGTVLNPPGFRLGGPPLYNEAT
jgi:hypothetical protein